MNILNFFKTSSSEQSLNKREVTEPPHIIISQGDYFQKYLGYSMQQLSSQNINNPTLAFFTSYFNLDFKLLEYLSQAGDMNAHEAIGEIYLFGLQNKPKDIKLATTYLSQATAAGNPQAMFQLAQIYRNPNNGMLDYTKSFSLTEQAAKGGNCIAMFNLSCAYFKGKDAYDGYGFEVDKQSAYNWSKCASESTMDMLIFIFTHPCDRSFRQDTQVIYNTFVQSTCVTCEQLVYGDGVAQDKTTARLILQNANNFHKQYFQHGCSDFEKLLWEIR